MRTRLLTLASRYPRVCRTLLRTFAGIVPQRWIISELMARCGGSIISNFRLGNGMKVQGFLGDLVCYHIAANGWYEPEMVEAVQRSLRPETIFFDVGAHIGQYSLMASTRCYEVHAFEANRSTAIALRHNVKSNHLSNVTVNECAVSEHIGTATFHELSGDNPGASSLYGKGQRVSVAAITLDAYCRKLSLNRRPVVLKIDVEGAELRVLRGAEHLLARGNVIIFAELIDRLQRRAGSSREEVLNYLQHHNYNITWFDDKNIVATASHPVPLDVRNHDAFQDVAIQAKRPSQ
jgi:FkbM family methyltransferase